MAGKERKKSRNKGTGLFLAALLLLFAAMIVSSSVKIVRSRQEQAQGAAAYASLAQSVVLQQEVSASGEEYGGVPEELPEEESGKSEVSRPPVVDFDALQAINPQAVGWIRSDTGDINYPVVQGTDNDYYLTHLVDGTYNSNGSIFVDFRNAADISDRNTFIYGHNMRNGAMFASLSLYSAAGYLEMHPELVLITREESFSLQVFAGCVVPGNSDLYQMTYRDDEEFASYVEKVKLLSDFSSDVQVGPQDRIVTLSTCSYDYDDARYLLFCKAVSLR